MLLPVYVPGQKETIPGKHIVLAGDIGATKTNLALFQWENGKATVLQEAKYQSHAFENFLLLLDDFVKKITVPDSICLGVAGPVFDGHVKFSNVAWEIDRGEIATHFGIKDVYLINDLEANAYGLAMLSEKEIAVIHAGDTSAIGNAAIIAPGTGLGEAGLYNDGTDYHPFATEGGHSDFAARDAFDTELLFWLQKQFEHVSWERLVCGRGIANIYHFLRDEKKREEPVWLTEKINAASADAAAIISSNTKQCDICRETMQLFIKYLAYESANLVLKLKATGGLFIGGGIAPQVIHLFDNDAFFSSFCKSGRLNYVLEKVPVKIILNNKTALLGAAYYGSKK